jgi:hypothetical protein
VRMANPRLSVNIEMFVCNHERFIDETLKSLLSQTFTNFGVGCGHRAAAVIGKRQRRDISNTGGLVLGAGTAPR